MEGIMKPFWKRTVGTCLAAGLLLSVCAASVGCSKEPKLTEADWNYEFSDGRSANMGEEYKNFLSMGGYNYSVTVQTDEKTETKQYLVQSDSSRMLGDKFYRSYYFGDAYYAFNYAVNEDNEMIYDENRQPFDDLVKCDLTEYAASGKRLHLRAFDWNNRRYVPAEERMAVSDLYEFTEALRDTFSLFTVQGTVATVTGNKAEFADLAGHAKTLYNLDGDVEWTEIKVNFKRTSGENYCTLDKDGNEIHYGVDGFSYKANVVGSQTVRSIEIRFEDFLSGDDYQVYRKPSELYFMMNRLANFTVTGVDTAEQGELYEFTENGFRMYRPNNADESLREVIVYHDTENGTYTKYAKTADGGWEIQSLTKVDFDAYIFATKKILVENFIDAMAQNIALIGKNRTTTSDVPNSDGKYEMVIAMQDGVTLTADIGGSLWNYTNVKFTGSTGGFYGNFNNFDKVEYTITRTVANVSSVSETYAIEVGKAEITLPTGGIML